MWCPNCRADVAAEVSSDHSRVRCASCGTEISISGSTVVKEKTREARDLLDRWAKDDLLHSFGPVVGAKPSTQQSTLLQPSSSHETLPMVESDDSQSTREPAGDVEVQRASAATQTPPAQRVFRVDPAHAPTDEPSPSASSALAESPAPAETLRDAVGSDENPPSISETRFHQVHQAAMPAPHFDVQAAIEEDHSRRTNWSAFWGQILAYFGVAGLTVGTTLVLWGYFGGPKSYTPTGWLIATAGQMLLFLGVVTLVSGGLEQTTEEVTQRLDRLGEKLAWIEQASRQNSLRRPPQEVRLSGDQPPDPPSAGRPERLKSASQPAEIKA